MIAGSTVTAPFVSLPANSTPLAGLIQGTDGNFYGTTPNGGSGLCADGFGVIGCGTIFSGAKKANTSFSGVEFTNGK